MKLRTHTDRKANLRAFKEKKNPIAKAATAAVTQAGDLAKKGARASIAGAGFGVRWQNALRVNVYPRRRASINAAALVYHKIPYAEVFEQGATIRARRGKLWIPLPPALRAMGGKRVTPARYSQTFGRLFVLKRAGKPPLLMGKAAGQPAAGLSRSGRAPKTNSIPLFFGVDTVTIKKRFAIIDAVERAAAQLPQLFHDSLIDE